MVWRLVLVLKALSWRSTHHHRTEADQEKLIADSFTQKTLKTSGLRSRRSLPSAGSI
jgi:hypothetical protein